MQKKLVLILSLFCVLALAASAFAAPPFTVKQIITYDGYLQQDVDFQTVGVTLLVADTLFVVNNTNKSAVQVPVWIEVFDKKGTQVADQTLYNSGTLLPNNQIPKNGFGWVTLGMLVGRDTKDPWGFPAGEKFLVKISTGQGDAGKTKATSVEVKQVIYHETEISPGEWVPGTTQPPGEAIWRADTIRAWAETALGGLRGPGLVKHPLNW